MTEQAPVSPEDREAFKDLKHMRDTLVLKMLDDGRFDDDPQMQLLTRHRLQAIAKVAEERDAFRSIVQNWVDAVTANGRNRETMLSINHDIIKGMVHVSRHALASSEGEA